MFNNLIESSSHKREIKRRGSFLLLTTATYAVLFAIAGVASIYAYDARLADQNTEIITLLTPADFPLIRPQTVIRAPSTSRNNSTTPTRDERQIPMASVDQPNLTPERISSGPNPSLPVRDWSNTDFTGRDVDGTTPGGPIGPAGSGGSDQPRRPVLPDIEVPPPAPVVKPIPKVVHKNIINSEALFLPKPPYPPIAKQTGTQGIVSVQVLIDETGKVVSARVVNGNPLLTHEAVRAAYQARFSPTILGDQAVKVSGVITYNFVLQR
jgi:protein TonB